MWHDILNGLTEAIRYFVVFGGIYFAFEAGKNFSWYEFDEIKERIKLILISLCLVLFIASAVSVNFTDSTSCVDGYSVETQDGYESECFEHDEKLKKELQEKEFERGVTIFLVLYAPFLIGLFYKKKED